MIASRAYLRHDDYCEDIYAMKNNGNHEIFHRDFNVQFDYGNQVSHDSYFVEFAPTIIMRRNLLMPRERPRGQP